MTTLHVNLFGKFSARTDRQTIDDLHGNKVHELFSYLLLYRERPHPREALATALWSDSPATQSKKGLRHSLWQLQTALDAHSDLGDDRVLLSSPGWIRLNPDLDLWLDVAVFERAFALVQGVSSDHLSPHDRQTLEAAVQLYQGDLLEGCYQDWCLYERERLQQMYLVMLSKLMSVYEAQHEYEAGIGYGSLILRYERASERTHRRLMRLFYLIGDRTAALRQYERCLAALDQEFGVAPSRRTVELYEQIRTDQFMNMPPALSDAALSPADAALPLPAVLSRLRQLGSILADVHSQLQHNIKVVEQVLHDRS